MGFEGVQLREGKEDLKSSEMGEGEGGEAEERPNEQSEILLQRRW